MQFFSRSGKRVFRKITNFSIHSNHRRGGSTLTIHETVFAGSTNQMAMTDSDSGSVSSSECFFDVLRKGSTNEKRVVGMPMLLSSGPPVPLEKAEKDREQSIQARGVPTTHWTTIKVSDTAESIDAHHPRQQTAPSQACAPRESDSSKSKAKGSRKYLYRIARVLRKKK